MVHEYDRTTRTLADYIHHIWFNQRIISNCQCLGPTGKGHEAELILEKLQNQILNERGRLLKVWIKTLTVYYRNIFIFPVVRKVTDFIENAKLSQRTKSKDSQTERFQTLISWASKTKNTEEPMMSLPKDSTLLSHHRFYQLLTFEQQNQPWWKCTWRKRRQNSSGWRYWLPFPTQKQPLTSGNVWQKHVSHCSYWPRLRALDGEASAS